MSEEPLFSMKNKLSVASTALTVGVAGLAAIAGFVLLPYAQPDLHLRNVWDAICSAAGVPRAAPHAVSIGTSYRTSTVVVTSRMLDNPGATAIGRGATLALQCAICHGVAGVGKADVPILSGQYAGVVYKELEDFKAGARTSAVMAPFASGLSERDMLDLAAFYGDRAREPGSGSDAPPPRIVLNGAPMRNIAPCAACHGGLGTKPGSPWLDGQPAAYLKAQLQGFATDRRQNDISAQMRNVARTMTPDEIDAAASYYAARR